MMQWLIGGQLITVEEYMERHQVKYLRALHEMGKLLREETKNVDFSKFRERSSGDVQTRE